MKRLLLGFIVISLSVCIYNLKTGLADDNEPNILSSHEDSIAMLQDEADEEGDETDPYATPTPGGEDEQYSDEEKDDQGSDEGSDENSGDDEEESEDEGEEYLY